MKHGTLVLVRHGESRLNELNRFTGWLDIPLSKKGLDEAHAVADHCQKFEYDAAFTSNLERAHETLLVILSHQRKIGIFNHEKDKRYCYQQKAPRKFVDKTIPIFTSEKLNERSYGDLQGLNKNSAVKTFGKTNVFNWRRGFSDRPPKGESLEDVYKRVVPYFKSSVHPLVKKGQTILITAHGNTLRALIKYIEHISNEQIPFVDLPTGRPLVYSGKKNEYKRIEGEYNFKRLLR